MVLRLDPDVPLVYRSTDALQLGVERDPVVLDPVGRAEEQLIAALRSGAPRCALDVVAAAAAPERPGLVDDLLAALGSLVRETAPAGRPEMRTAKGCLVLGSTPLASAIAGALLAIGVSPESGPLGLVVLVADRVLAPRVAVPWMSRDLPHLPVVAADGVVLVGPVVRPGVTPCLYCVHRTRADRDPAWPVVAGQLLGLAAPRLDALALTEAVALGARTALHALSGTESPATVVVLDTASGRISERGVAPHPVCACGAHPGSGWARGVAPLRPAATRDAPPRSERAAAEPA